MTEQSPADKLNRASNEIFEATSFLNGTNAAYVEQMYGAWQADPNSVDASWQAYFSQTGEQGLSPTQLGRGPAWKRDARPQIPASDLIAALTGQDPPAAPAKPGPKGDKAKPAAAAPAADAEAPKHSIHAVQMIRAYRMIGHLEAELDPLKITPPGSQILPVRRSHPGPTDLCRRCPGFPDRHPAPAAGKAAQHLLQPYRL